MTFTNSASVVGATFPASKVDVAAVEILCSLYLARTYGEDQPGVWCEDARGIAAARAVGVKRSHSDFDHETAFVAGFDLGVRVSTIIANDPCGPVGLAIDAELARTRDWLGIADEASPPPIVHAAPIADADARDARATKRAVADGRRLLADHLPKVVAELQRQAAVIAAAHENLEGDLSGLAAVFEQLVNPRGILADEPRDNAAIAIDLMLGRAYIAKNGDTSYCDLGGDNS